MTVEQKHKSVGMRIFIQMTTRDDLGMQEAHPAEPVLGIEKNFRIGENFRNVTHGGRNRRWQPVTKQNVANVTVQGISLGNTPRL
jgi:hypothetical protein